MYAVGTSSNTDRPDWYRDELELIEALCEATGQAGWSLLIKPKPNGRTGDFDHLAAAYPHVEVGLYRDAPSALDYYLDDEYNRCRLEELEQCDLVVNCWTTFALDAAAAGKPVLQLDARSVVGWPALKLGLENYHLSNYILSRSNTLRPTPETELIPTVVKRLAALGPEAWRVERGLMAGPLEGSL